MYKYKSRVIDNNVVNNPRYEVGVNVLNLILQKKTIPEDMIKEIHEFDDTWSYLIIDLFKRRIDSLYSDKDFVGGTVRQRNFYAPQYIAESRRAIEKNEVFMKFHGKILDGKELDKESLEYFFGDNAMQVKVIYGLFQKLGMSRECFIPLAAHSNRMAGTLWQLMKEPDAKKEGATQAAAHDAGEDILSILKDEKGRLYGLTRYDEFVEKYIPEIVRSPFAVFTNYRQMFIKQAESELISKKTPLSLYNISRYLSSQYRKMPQKHTLKSKLEDLLVMFKDDEFVASIDTNDITESLKSRLYPLYTQDIFSLCVKINDFKPVDTKSVDLSDNGHGKNDTSLSSRLKNMVKRIDFVYNGDKTNEILAQKNWLMDQKMRELEEDALVDSINLVVDKLIMPETVQDYQKSFSKCILALQPVFYTGHPSTFYPVIRR